MTILKEVKQEMDELVGELLQADYIKKDSLFVIGCSTSEVIGMAIGTAGSDEAGEAIFTALQKLHEEKCIHLAFQCCEHLNRALVIERATLDKYQLEEVSVIPVREAGGSMATYAYNQFRDPVMVEAIQADAGIDLGDTFIGMHLKPVAVPVRLSVSKIGNAHLTIARTRPKLIGGVRAVYP